jgi:site-specific recombinase XerD
MRMIDDAQAIDEQALPARTLQAKAIKATELARYDPESISGAMQSVAAVIHPTDALIVRMWLAGMASKHTQRNYQSDVNRLFNFLAKPMADTTLADLQAFASHLEASRCAASTRRRILAAVKSLFSFASDGGIRHVRYNVAAAMKLPKSKDTLNERILTEAQVSTLIAAAAPGRNRMIVELLYLVGLRAEELATLCWRDAKADGECGVLTVFGKGQKTRHLRMSPATWRLLQQCRFDKPDSDPIFPSRQGGALSTVQIWRIVSQAARKAGLDASPHWLRHSHSTHAIDHGCDLRTLQQSLGHASSVTTERYVHSRPKQSSGAFVESPEPKR